MMGVGNSDVLPGYLGTSVPGYLGGTWVPTCDNNHMGHVPGYLPVNLKSQVPGTWPGYRVVPEPTHEIYRMALALRCVGVALWLVDVALRWIADAGEQRVFSEPRWIRNIAPAGFNAFTILDIRLRILTKSSRKQR